MKPKGVLLMRYQRDELKPHTHGDIKLVEVLKKAPPVSLSPESNQPKSKWSTMPLCEFVRSMRASELTSRQKR
jgi:hypothetical protein